MAELAFEPGQSGSRATYHRVKGYLHQGMNRGHNQRDPASIPSLCHSKSLRSVPWPGAGR